MNNEAQPTHYKGINFRSRFEAYTARILDVLAVPWVYEATTIQLERGADCYRPDFIINGKSILEVKGDSRNFNEIGAKRDVIETKKAYDSKEYTRPRYKMIQTVYETKKDISVVFDGYDIGYMYWDESTKRVAECAGAISRCGECGRISIGRLGCGRTCPYCKHAIGCREPGSSTNLYKAQDTLKLAQEKKEERLTEARANEIVDEVWNKLRPGMMSGLNVWSMSNTGEPPEFMKVSALLASISANYPNMPWKK